MPTLDARPRNRQRILIVGDPGAGKTTCIGHLLDHGYKLFVADFDDGLDPIPKWVKPENLSNLVYARLMDRVVIDQRTGYPRTSGKPTAFHSFIKLTDRWVDEDGTDYGKPEEWDDKTWLVVDNATALGRAALFYTQDVSRKMGERVSLPILGGAIARVEGVAESLQAADVNLIMLAHLAPVNTDRIEDSEEAKPAGAQAMTVPVVTKKLFPVTLGTKLPRRFGQYFTTIIQVKLVGSGARVQRVIRTVPDDEVDIKLPVSQNALPMELPLNQLHKVIEALRA